MNQKLRGLLIVFFAALFLYSAWQVMGTLQTSRERQSAYTALEQYVSFETAEAPRTDPDPTEITQSTETSAPAGEGGTSWPQIDFDALAEINPDIVGWICIEGTDINYPVVQGPDNDYYLNHLFDGTQNSSGCIFLDCRCAADFSDRHSIFYGHHMKDKSMFSALVNYKDPDFYREHPTALLATPTAYYRIRFFSGYVSDNWSNAWELAPDESSHAAWLQDIRERSCFDTDASPTAQERILTLSTCTYEFESAKFVLHGYICETLPGTKSA